MSLEICDPRTGADHDGRSHGHARKIADASEGDQRARSDLALADPDHDVGSARDEARLGIRGGELPGFFESGGEAIRERPD